jgi:hypothetical protein
MRIEIRGSDATNTKTLNDSELKLVGTLIDFSGIDSQKVVGDSNSRKTDLIRSYLRPLYPEGEFMPTVSCL